MFGSSFRDKPLHRRRSARGLIFLEYISDAFEERRAAVLAKWGEDAAEDRDEYTAENICGVPPEARWPT